MLVLEIVEYELFSVWNKSKGTSVYKIIQSVGF